MKDEQLEAFRIGILQVLDANTTQFGLGAKAVRLFLNTLGFPSVTEDDVTNEIEYLNRRDLVMEVLKTVSRENRAWRITKAGVAFLDARA